MIVEVCSYNECITNVINMHDSLSNIDCLFFILAITLQQRRIGILYAGRKKDVTLLDFVFE
jgi:hypothetical protein